MVVLSNDMYLTAEKNLINAKQKAFFILQNKYSKK